MKPQGKKLKGKATLLFDKDGLKIEIEDELSSTVFLCVEIDPENACAAMGRLSSVDCTMDVGGLERIGKKMEMDKLEFEMPQTHQWQYSKEKAAEIARRVCPEGWAPDVYFGAQNSFFQKDGQQWARCTIRRWVEVE